MTFLPAEGQTSAKFLYDLGLQRYPAAAELVNLAAGPDAKIRAVALKYLDDNIATKYKDFNLFEFGQVAFIPALKDDQVCLGTPEDVGVYLF